MYKIHLILKYLLKRRIAWVSLAAVALCTLMVLVVISPVGSALADEGRRDLVDTAASSKERSLPRPPRRTLRD